MGLLNIRDQVSATRDLVGCLCLACQHVQTREERAALSSVSHAVREKLRAIDEALKYLIGGEAEDEWSAGEV